jgi:hypothetical protein
MSDEHGLRAVHRTLLRGSRPHRAHPLTCQGIITSYGDVLLEAGNREGPVN